MLYFKTKYLNLLRFVGPSCLLNVLFFTLFFFVLAVNAVNNFCTTVKVSILLSI